MITKLRGYVATFFRDPKKPKVQRLGKYRDGKAQLLLWLKFFSFYFLFHECSMVAGCVGIFLELDHLCPDQCFTMFDPSVTACCMLGPICLRVHK